MAIPFTLGSDPEFFVEKDGKFVPSFGICSNAGKYDPLPLGHGVFAQEDNVLIEVNPLPAKSEEDFLEKNHIAKELLTDLVEGRGFTINFDKRYHLFDISELLALGPRATTLGCSCDIQARTGVENPAPKPTVPVRSAGGHIHIGIPRLPRKKKLMLGVALDYFVGLPSLLFDPGTVRRSLYGQAGAIRLKKYGVEYRVPSNFWFNSPDAQVLLYNGVRRAIDNIDKLDYLDKRIPLEEVQTIINTGNVQEAQNMLLLLEE